MTLDDTAIAALDKAKLMLSSVRTLEQAVEIRDRASAIAAYARARGADEAHLIALEIKLRAEYRAGRFLKEMEKAKGTLLRGNNLLPREKELPRLKDLGIDKKESARWQKIASIPEKRFEEYIADTTKRTQAAMLQAASPYVRPKPKTAETPPYPSGKYKCIVVDPPWPMEKFDRAVRPDQGKYLDYDTMTLDEISAIPLQDFADPDGCQVYLWTTHRFLPDAFRIFSAWGVNYHCLLTWVKPTGMTPMSWMFNTEHVLFGYIGHLNVLRKGLKVSFEAPVTKHSEKPDVFYDLVRQVSRERRVDMFARREHDGFEKWGAEAVYGDISG